MISMNNNNFKKPTSQLLQQRSLYFNSLNQSLSKEFSNYPTFFSNPIDMFIWGYLSAYHEESLPMNDILNKLLIVNQMETNQLITSNDKLNIYIMICQNHQYDLNSFFDNQFEEQNINQNPYPIQIIDQNPCPIQIPINHDIDIESKEESKFNEEVIENISLEDKLTEELIKRIRLEEKMEREKIREEKDQINKAVPCSICLEPLLSKEFISLEICHDIYHLDCILEHVKFSIDGRNLPIKCPGQCNQHIDSSDFMGYLDAEYLTKYEEFSLKNYLDMHADEVSWCPTPDCKYVFIHEKNVETDFSCLLCGKHYCLACRTDFHEGMTCEQYKMSINISEADEAFINFAKGQKFKQCPKCKFWVEKNQGCDHMTCRCKFEFCYKCGGTYKACDCVKQQNNLSLFANPNVQISGQENFFQNLFSNNVSLNQNRAGNIFSNARPNSLGPVNGPYPGFGSNVNSSVPMKKVSGPYPGYGPNNLSKIAINKPNPPIFLMNNPNPSSFPINKPNVPIFSTNNSNIPNFPAYKANAPSRSRPNSSGFSVNNSNAPKPNPPFS